MLAPAGAAGRLAVKGTNCRIPALLSEIAKLALRGPRPFRPKATGSAHEAPAGSEKKKELEKPPNDPGGAHEMWVTSNWKSPASGPWKSTYALSCAAPVLVTVIVCSVPKAAPKSSAA